LLLFALLSLSDLGLTCYLLCAGSGTVYESNPIAAWWLERFGWLGLAAFKVVMATVAGVLGILVFLRRPRAGNQLLVLGCAVLAAVVLYSGYLCDTLRRQPAGLDPVEAAQLEGTAQHLDEVMRRSANYRTVMNGAVGDLRARRCTLAEAVARLAATEQGQDESWLRHFQLYYPGRGDHECLALSLLNHFQLAAADASAERPLPPELRAQFHALYGRDLPPDERFSATAVRPPVAVRGPFSRDARGSARPAATAPRG
jgi:hypothetical protein